MYKIKKTILFIIMILFLLLSSIELIYYLFSDSNLFGVIYLLVNIFIIFLFVPVTYNYKRNFSKSRISKLILIILFGLFNSYFLSNIVVNSMNYTDTSKNYIESIFVIKSILKPILLLFISFFTVVESKVILKLKKSHQPK